MGSITQWEYDDYQCSQDHGIRDLDHRGRRGWEVFAVVPMPNLQMRYYMRRPLEEAKRPNYLPAYVVIGLLGGTAIYQIIKALALWWFR